MSAAQVAKLEALLARVHSRRLEPGLRLVDASIDEPETIPPPASPSSLLTLDEPVMAVIPAAPVVAAASVAAIPVAASAPVTRTTLDVDADLDDLDDLDDLVDLDTDPVIEPVEDALVTAVARPAPIMQLDEPVARVPVAPVAPVAAAPVAAAQSRGPVVMQAPLPVASGPIAGFVGAPPHHTRSFGELVGLAMSLTTR